VRPIVHGLDVMNLETAGIRMIATGALHVPIQAAGGAAVTRKDQTG
jgi:hypothetical protein